MYFSDDVLEDIRYGNDIVDVIGAYVKLEERGNNHFGLCPFHSEKTASFSVNREKQFYHCFGCGASGNVFGFIMQIENHSFPDAVRLLAERIHYTIPTTPRDNKLREQREEMREAHVLAARFFHKNLMGEQGGMARSYLVGRNIRADLSQKFGIGYTGGNFFGLSDYLTKEHKYSEEFLIEAGLCSRTKKGKLMDRFRERLIFPIFDRGGGVVGFGGRAFGDDMPKYLNSPDTRIFDKRFILYGLHFARETKKKELILVEGYLDVIRLHQAGHFNCAATMGTALSEGHAKEIKKYFDTCTLLFDGDDAGIRAVERSIPILVKEGIMPEVLQLPDGLDPDDYISREGANAFTDFYENNKQNHVMFQVKMIKQNFNVNDVGEQIGFQKDVASLISEMDSAIERQAYGKEVAAAFDLPEQALLSEIDTLANKEVEDPRRPMRRRQVITNKRSDKSLDSARRELLYAMSLEKEYADIIKKHVDIDMFDHDVYKKAYTVIGEAIEKEEPVLAGTVLNYFETPEEQKMAASIFNEEAEKNDREVMKGIINGQIKLLEIEAYNIKKEEAVKDGDIEKMNEIQKILFDIPTRNYFN